MRRDKMRILLVAPSALDARGRLIKQRRLHVPALTLSVLAALTPREFEPHLVNETVQEIPFDEPWDLVGLTAMGSGIVRAWQIAREFRRRGVPTVLGGIGPSLLGPEQSLRHVDSLVLGEAEEIWPRALSDVANGGLQPVYRMERRPPIEMVPEPRYDLLDKPTLGLWRPVQATRGCPLPCSFCSISAFYEATQRKAPIDQVIRDVRAAKRSGSSFIAFVDDNISIDFDYAADLWEALIPEKIRWMSHSSLHIARRPELLKLAHRSGCRMLSFGIESVDRRNLKRVNKHWNSPERYREAVDIVRSHGIDFAVDMIVGLDDDDDSVFGKTFDFIMENRIGVPRVHIMTPIPGTPLHREYSEGGRILSDDFARYTGADVVFRPRKMLPRELREGYWKLHERLFSWRSILRRTCRNHARMSPLLRCFLLGVNLHYRHQVRRRIPPGIV